MGNRIVRVVLGIIIGIAALVGIYLILPGNLKYPMQEWFQKTFQSSAYEVSEHYMKTKVPKQDITFGDMIANCSNGSSAWVCEVLSESEDKSTGLYTLHAYAYKVDVSMEHENGQENLQSYSQAGVEITFEVEKKGKDNFVTRAYNVYIDEQYMNDFYKAQALQSLCGKAKAEMASQKNKSEATTAAQ